MSTSWRHDMQSLILMRRPLPYTWAASIASLMLLLSVLSGCGRQARARSPAAAKSTPPLTHGRCPLRDRRLQPSSDPRTATVLVPPHPTGVSVCRYWGDEVMRGRWKLAASRDVPSDRALARLVARLDGLDRPQAAPPPSCPVLGGRSVVLVFHYRGATDDPVRILRATCIEVSNGRLDRWGQALALGEHWPDEGLL